MLCQHGLLLHDSARGQHYYVHTAVREAGKAALDRETAASLQERYIAYVLQLLGGWAQLHVTKAASLALSEARAHAADLRLVGAEDDVGDAGLSNPLTLLLPCLCSLVLL